MNIEAIIQKLRARIEEDTRDLEALERIAKKHGANGVSSVAKLKVTISGATQQRMFDSGEFMLTRALDEVLDNYIPGDKFNKSEVVGEILSRYPTADVNPASVSSMLWMKAKAGHLDVVERGIGKKQSVYRKRDRAKDHAETKETVNDF